MIGDSIFLSFSILLMSMIMIPGSNFVLVCHTTLCNGLSVGIATVAGISTASLVHGTLTLLGISIIIASNEFLFSAIRFTGSAYLCYLGANALYLAHTKCSGVEKMQTGKLTISYKAGFRRGLLANLLNPVAIVFYLIVYPKIVDLNMPQNKTDLVLLLVLGFILYAMWFFSVALCVDKIKTTANGPGIGRSVNMLGGGLLLGLGVVFLIQSIQV